MNPLRAWNSFWFRPISARPLGAFRIAFGLVFLLNLALLSIEIDYWFTDHGLLVGTEAREAAGPLRLSPLHYVQDPVSIRLFFGAVAAVGVLYTLGWHTRVMGVLLYLGMLSIHHRNISSANGADVLLMILTFYAMLAPCGAAYSLDARRARRKRGGTLAEPLVIPWAQRLIQIQLTLIYLNTALLKAGGSSWQNGTALHYVLNNAEIRRFSLGLPNYPLLINLMTYGALMVEFAIPFLLWVKKARPWVIVLGLGLHATILVFVNIPIFGELMAASYLTFLAPDELDAALRRLNPANWVRKRNGQAADLAESLALATATRFDQPAPLPGPHWVSAEPTDSDLEHAGFRREWDDAP